MTVVYQYSHLGGAEILRVGYPQLERQIYRVISQVRADRTKVSEEKTMRGKRLYSPKGINRQFRERFNELGFRELRDTYTITIPGSEVSIPGAYKQIDFVKGKLLVGV